MQFLTLLNSSLLEKQVLRAGTDRQAPQLSICPCEEYEWQAEQAGFRFQKIVIH
jgi:hypothetical protein